MKEIWIEKLIELLNEYNEIHNYAPIEYYDDEANGFETNYVAFYKTCIIISKQFWFIKRLVDNDKIDRDSKNLELDMKRMRIPQDYYISWVQSLDIQHKKAQYLSLIALLSIQDNPIEFLISYLK